MQKKILRSMRVLYDGNIQPADLILGGGLILNVAGYGSQRDAVDLGQLLILPGLVDIHSDAVEKEIEPRPGATFPIRQSLIELDKKLAMSGITTMFHAIAFNDESITTSRSTAMAEEIIEQIHATNRTELSVDNFIHARYEITSFPSAAVIRKLIANGRIQLLSIMDHTPGQGQFKSIETWKRFHLPTYDLTDAQAETIISKKRLDQKQAYYLVKELLDFAKENDMILLSHDDDLPEKIDVTCDLGITISEFPLGVDVAAYAQKKGLATGMGAPNVVRGKSQSGNISARQVIENQCCDFLCSDYHPSSLLQAAFVMNREMQMPLSTAVAMVSSTPAKIAGLNDRGRIAPDLLADLTILDDRDIPKIVTTLKAGEVVYNAIGCLCT